MITSQELPVKFYSSKSVYFKPSEMLVQLLKTRAKRAVTDSMTFALKKVRVKVNQGVVRGCEEKLPDGRSFFRFSGIPFAKPPINELRYRSPQKLQKFDKDEIDCTRERDVCFHKSPVWARFWGSEDCLNLNVYVPADVDKSKKLPVMLWVHGGAFGFDSNRRDLYSPEHLLMEDVIVVAINYRLHVLGFSSLPSLGISGNAGLKDQQMALEWVYENISHFNGDPNNICMFGESAGAACTHLHVLNDKSRSMLSKVILQSGTAISDWVIQRDGVEKTRRVARKFGSKGNSDQDHLDTLMKAPLEGIYLECVKVIDPDERRRSMPIVFKPIIEEESDDAFLTKDPIDIIREMEGKLNLPMIIGLNNGDGMSQTAPYKKRLHVYGNDMRRLIPLSLNVDPESDEAGLLAKDIEKFYLGKRGLTPQTISLFVGLNTDFYFSTPLTVTNELYMRYQQNCKQYVYEFCLNSKLNFFKKALKMTDVPGAGHFDEVSYLFGHKITGFEFPESSREHQLRKMMCKFWTNFAKYGEPTPNHDDSYPVKWNYARPIDRDANDQDVIIDYLKIDNDEVKMYKNMYKERIDFWRGVYKKYNKSYLNPKPLGKSPSI